MSVSQSDYLDLELIEYRFFCILKVMFRNVQRDASIFLESIFSWVKDVAL